MRHATMSASGQAWWISPAMKVPCPASGSMPPSRAPDLVEPLSRGRSGRRRSRSARRRASGRASRRRPARGACRSRCPGSPRPGGVPTISSSVRRTGAGPTYAIGWRPPLPGARRRTTPRRSRSADAGWASWNGLASWKGGIVERVRVDAAHQHDVVEPDPAHRLEAVRRPRVLQQHPAVRGDRGLLVAARSGRAGPRPATGVARRRRRLLVARSSRCTVASQPSVSATSCSRSITSARPRVPRDDQPGPDVDRAARADALDRQRGARVEEPADDLVEHLARRHEGLALGRERRLPDSGWAYGRSGGVVGSWAPQIQKGGVIRGRSAVSGLVEEGEPGEPGRGVGRTRSGRTRRLRSPADVLVLGAAAARSAAGRAPPSRRRRVRSSIRVSRT